MLRKPAFERHRHDLTGLHRDKAHCRYEGDEEQEGQGPR